MKFKYFIILLAILFIGCSPKGNYIASPDGKHYLTLFERTDSIGKSYTFITYGKVNGEKMPDSYIKVRNKYFDAWYCLISWKGSKAIIYHPYSEFTGHHLNDQIELKEMRDKEFSKIFFNDKEDHYFRLSSYNKDSLNN